MIFNGGSKERPEVVISQSNGERITITTHTIRSQCRFPRVILWDHQMGHAREVTREIYEPPTLLQRFYNTLHQIHI